MAASRLHCGQKGKLKSNCLILSTSPHLPYLQKSNCTNTRQVFCTPSWSWWQSGQNKPIEQIVRSVMWHLFFCFLLKAVTIEEKLLLHPEFLMKFATQLVYCPSIFFDIWLARNLDNFSCKRILLHMSLKYSAILMSKPVNIITTSKIS